MLCLIDFAASVASFYFAFRVMFCVDVDDVVMCLFFGVKEC